MILIDIGSSAIRAGILGEQRMYIPHNYGLLFVNTVLYFVKNDSIYYIFLLILTSYVI